MEFVSTVDTDTILPGQGFNTIAAKHGGQGVLYNGPEDLTTVLPDATGYSTSYTLKEVKSFYEMKESLSISASASAGVGIYSGSASSRYIRSKTFTKYSLSIFIDISVTAPPLVLKSSKMTPTALKAAEHSLGRFLGYCGDVYCYGIQQGGQFTAIIDFAASTTKEHSQLVASARAAVSNFGGGGVEFEKTVSELSALSNFSMTILRKGPADATPTLNELAEYSRNFPEKVANGGAKIIAALLRSYETTENFPLDYANDFDPIVLERMGQTMNIICNDLDRLYEAQGDLQFLSSRMAWYAKGVALKEEIDTAFENNEAEISKLIELAIQLRSNPTMEAPIPAHVMTVDPGEEAGDPIPAVIVEMYEHINYEGQKVSLNASHTNFDHIGFGDKLSSFKIFGEPDEYEVEFYSDGNFSGKRIVFRSPVDYPDIRVKWPFASDVQPFQFVPLPGWNDQVHSVRITKLK